VLLTGAALCAGALEAFLRHLVNEAGGEIVGGLAVKHALLGAGHHQLLLGAGNRHVAQTALLLHFVSLADAAHTGENAVLHAHKEHGGELEPLGAVDGHHGHGGLGLVHLVKLGVKGGLLQKAVEAGLSRALHVGEDVTFKLLHVFGAGAVFLSVGGAEHGHVAAFFHHRVVKHVQRKLLHLPLQLGYHVHKGLEPGGGSVNGGVLAAVGDNVDTVISLYIKNKVTGEVTETIKLNVRLKRVSDFESEMIPEFKYKIKLDGTAEITDYVGVRYVTNLTVPASFGGVKVTSIGKEAFKESRELVSVRIPEGITFIDTSAFALCTSLKEVYLPESVTKVGRAAFYYCNSLEAVTLPSGLVRIPDYMFYMCTKLESVTHSKSLEEIGKYAFSNCILTDFDFNEGLQIVGEYAFEGCAFTKIYLPDSCTYAGHWAFYNCLWLAEASFGDNLELIGSGILYNTSVKELHFRGSAEQFKKIYQLSAFDDEFPIIFEK